MKRHLLDVEYKAFFFLVHLHPTLPPRLASFSNNHSLPLFLQIERKRVALLGLCRFSYFPGVPLICKLNDSTHNPSVSGSGTFCLMKKKEKKRYCQERGIEKPQPLSDDYSRPFCWALLNLICPPAQREPFSNVFFREKILTNAGCVSKVPLLQFLKSKFGSPTRKVTHCDCKEYKINPKDLMITLDWGHLKAVKELVWIYKS